MQFCIKVLVLNRSYSANTSFHFSFTVPLNIYAFVEMSKKNFPKETIRIKRRKETVWFVFAHGLKFGEVKGKPILI